MGDEILYKRVEQEATSIEEGSFMSKSKEGSSEEKSALERMEATSDEEFHDALDTPYSENTAQVAKMQTFKERRKANTSVKTESKCASEKATVTQTSRLEECLANEEAKHNEYDKDGLSRSEEVLGARNIKVASFCDVGSEAMFVDETQKNSHSYTSLTKLEQSREHVLRLKGVHIRHNAIDIDCNCDHLIQFEVNNLASYVSKEPQQDNLYFSSSRETDNFLSLFDLIGTDAFYQIKNRDTKELYFPSCTKENLSLETDQTQSYLTLYTIPIGELDMNQAVITFTSMALKSLHHIQHLLGNGFLEQANIQTREYFRKFGSHIYVNKIVVGGYLLLRTDILEACNDETTKKCHAQKLYQILTSLVSTDASENSLKTQSDAVKQLCIRKGGSNINITLKDWESALYEYPQLSIAISHGSCQIKDYRGIWEFIEQMSIFENHPKADELSDFLQKVWKDSQMQNAYVYRQRSLLPSSDVEKCIHYATRSISEIRKGSKSIKETVDVLSYLSREIQHSNKGKRKEWRAKLEKSGLLDAVPKILLLQNNVLRESCSKHFIELLQGTEIYLSPFGKQVFLSVMEWIIENKHNIFEHLVDDFIAKTFSMLVELEFTQAKIDKNFCHYLMIEKYLDNSEIVFEDKQRIVPTARLHITAVFQCVKESSFNVSNDLPTQVRLLSEFEGNSHMIKKIKHFIAVTPIGVDPRIRSILFEKGNNLKLKLDQLSDQSVVESLQWKYFEEKEKDFFEQTESINQQSQYTEGKGQLQLNVCKIFEILGLRKHYPGKISIQDVQSHINGLFEKPEDMTDVPWIFLREIIVVNCGFRESILGALHRTKNKVKGNLLSNYRSQDIAKQTSFTTTKSVFPHPCDVLLAVYLCSDMNLQRILANKIASCQLAIPFIHPTFEDNSLGAMTWPLREIIIGGEGLSAFSSELPIVSFVRVGQCDFRSKSKLINEVLRDENEEHATFFHRDCSLGQLQRQISNGVIEVSWFVPSTKDKSSWSKVSKEKEQSGEGRNDPPSLSEPFVVLNLRGDAHDLVMQTTLLCQITDIFVVLIDSSNLCNSSLHHTLQGVHTSNSRFILVTNLPEDGNISQVISKYENDTKMDVERTALISLYDCETKSYKNASEVKCLLTNQIADSLHLISERKGLETALDKTTVQIILDENDNSCRVGKELASSVFEVLMKPGSKANALPLQGEDLWQKLSKEEKERNRVGNLDLYDISEKRLKKINQIKEKQFDKCNSLHEFPLFIESLYRCHGDPLLSRFFLSWLKLFLDNCSRDRSRQKQEDFREALLRYQKARSKTTIKFENAEKEKSNAKKLLEDAEKDLANDSFGLEHCFREIGQVFEAIMNIQELKRVELREKSKIVCQHLPRIVAKLLLLGQPFELMDGDAANVPLKWIKAVFGELQNCVGNAKVFVVSVLGIQSSGKSTLLNSMFGLQFAVSAGRCTRGIYTQLLPLGNREQDFGFDYIMIIDTEGLRAPELLERKVHHDNELATLVVGMADYTIINIKGETMADIENVLQIVVHALLRLKQANNNIHLKQSCVLVHQNVSAQDAEKQMQRGHRITIQNLDKITQEVAKTEHLSANYNSFSDVITFDASTCIKFVPDLWHGTPPMAPVNKKYSLKVKEIFDHMLQVASDKQKLTISHTIDNFECLWKGILKEDFVFSFRNNLEVKAYSLLESEYQRLIWRLEEAYLTCFNANVRPRLSKCDCENDLEICARTLTHEFIGTIQKVKTDVEKDFESFIEKSELYEQMIQWKENKLLGIQNLVSQMITSFEEKVRSIKLHNKIELSSSNLINEKEKEINDKAQILATSFRGVNPSDAELKQAFEDMWKNWIKEIEKETPPVSHEDQKRLLLGDMKTAFCNDILLRRHNALLQKEEDFETFTPTKQNRYLTGSFQLLPDKHLSLHGHWNKVKGKVGKLYGVDIDRDEAGHDLNHVLGKIDTYLWELYKQENECTSLEFKHILKILTQFYSRHNDKEGNYTFNNHLQVQLAVHVSRFVFSHFCEMNSRFYERKSVNYQLKEYKPKAFRIFNDRVRAKTNEIIASNIFWTELKDKIYEDVMVNVTVTMKKCILSHFNFQKYHLTKQILEELCIDPEFSTYFQYTRDPESFARQTLEKFMNEKVFDRNGSDTFYIWTENETRHVFSQINATLSKLGEIKFESMEILRKEFVKRIGVYVSLKPQSFSHIIEQNVGDIMNFNKCVIESSKEAQSRIEKRFSHLNSRTVEWIDRSPFDDIFNTLWGCTEVCPFCGEPCQYSASDHPVKHRCIQHRPTGFNGSKWRESRKLVIESCNFHVQSTHVLYCGSWCGCTAEGCEEYHPYKEYIKYVPKWDISPQPDMIGSRYWAWVLCKFHKELAEHYRVYPPDIPESWLQITKQEAKESLSIFET